MDERLADNRRVAQEEGDRGKGGHVVGGMACGEQINFFLIIYHNTSN